MDSLLGNLVQRADSTKLPVNIILVSDHGMSELMEKEETYIFLDELARTTPGILTVANGGTQAHLYTTSPKQRDSLYTALQSKAIDFLVYKRENFPERWHYSHERSGDLLIVAKPGKYIVTGNRQKMIVDLKPGAKFGVHGYDPDEVPEMKGIFYARGPNIKSGSKIPAFRNIHVYPLIAEILKLKLPEIDGNLNVLKPIYRK
jgi:alkaline phosphatase D